MPDRKSASGSGKRPNRRAATMWAHTRKFREIDLHGKIVDQALLEVAEAINDALKHREVRIRINHGKGTGTLRNEIRTMLRQQTVLHSAFEGTIQALAAAIDAKDAYTGGHSAEVSQHAQAIARGLRLSPPDIDAVRIAGYLHDLGKIGIPDHILRKAGPLDPAEREQVRTHSIIGYRILRPIPVDERVKLAVLHNHERWDGTGYPDGLSGNQIPIHARILMVADAYEAMTSTRPYRRALEPMEAVAQLRAESGRQFDPDAVEAFIRTLRMNGQSVPRGVRGRIMRHPSRLR